MHKVTSYICFLIYTLAGTSMGLKGLNVVSLTTVGGVNLGGNISLVAFIDPECKGPCRNVMNGLISIRGLLERKDIPVQFVTVLTPMVKMSDIDLQEYLRPLGRVEENWQFTQLPANSVAILLEKLQSADNKEEGAMFMNGDIYIVSPEGAFLRAMSCLRESDAQKVKAFVLRLISSRADVLRKD